ncbi:hypothetical protein NC651_029816 [Populus alba x Populus x berolinensis]|nr:hypothetical protein NC651_029816 [Populus alba x Populus x berolinensis]
MIFSTVGVQRQQVLEQVDKELSKGDERAALSLVKDLQGKPGGLKCFGAARQRQGSLLSPVDANSWCYRKKSDSLLVLLEGLLHGYAFGFSSQQILLFSWGCCFCGLLGLLVSFNVVLAAWFLIQVGTPSVRSTTTGLFNAPCLLYPWTSEFTVNGSGCDITK